MKKSTNYQLPTTNSSSALVVFSGGQDSTTCLAWALKNFNKVHTITFDYGQRHKVEIRQAKKICKLLSVPQKILKLNFFQQITTSALTNSDIKIRDTSSPSPDKEKGLGDEVGVALPTSFVPGRNLIFLSTATIYAHRLGIQNIVTGVCQTDYSGYPDCRNDFIQSLEHTINLALGLSQETTTPSSTPLSRGGLGWGLRIHTPLMFLTKAETIKLMSSLGHLDLLTLSHTCYEGLRPACGKCPACKLRLKGFTEAGMKDPLKYRTIY